MISCLYAITFSGESVANPSFVSLIRNERTNGLTVQTEAEFCSHGYSCLEVVEACKSNHLLVPVRRKGSEQQILNLSEIFCLPALGHKR